MSNYLILVFHIPFKQESIIDLISPLIQKVKETEFTTTDFQLKTQDFQKKLDILPNEHKNLSPKLLKTFVNKHNRIMISANISFQLYGLEDSDSIAIDAFLDYSVYLHEKDENFVVSFPDRYLNQEKGLSTILKKIFQFPSIIFPNWNTVYGLGKDGVCLIGTNGEKSHELKINRGDWPNNYSISKDHLYQLALEDNPIIYYELNKTTIITAKFFPSNTLQSIRKFIQIQNAHKT